MKLVLDTDTGVDDAFAIALALNSPEIELLALTTVAGNAAVTECTRNCLLLGELLMPAAPPPVAEGAAAPLVKTLLTAPEVHGGDGLGGTPGTLPVPSRGAVDRPAHEVLIEAGRRDPGAVTLVATGPLTNLALALEADPDGLAAFQGIVVMGGAFGVPGNTGPVAEFNFYVDPEAADTVMLSGLNITLVPLDATTQVAVMRSELDGLPGWRPALRAPPDRGPSAADAAASGSLRDPRAAALRSVLARALDYYIAYQRSESGLDGGYMHDPVTLASVLEPDLLEARSMSVRVVLDGDDRGRSREGGTDDPPVRVATDVDGAAFMRLLTERVLRPVFGA